MFIFVVGDRGDGKSLMATRFACQAQKAITNFPVFKDSIERLRVKHVFDDYKPDEKAQKKRWRVQWSFWEDKKGYSVFIDEAYMQFDSREPHDIKNKIWSSWGAQSRKFLGNQGKSRHLQKLFKLDNNRFMKLMPRYINSLSNFWILTQSFGRIDKNIRHLINVLISCEQVVMFGREVTACYCWHGTKWCDALRSMEMGDKPKIFYVENKKWYDWYDTDFFSREVDIEEPEGYL